MSDSIQAFLPLLWRHLWETTLVVGAVIIFMPLLRRQRARLRHAVWLAASAKFLVPFSGLVALGTGIEWSGRPVIEIPMSVGTGSQILPTPTFLGPAESVSFPAGWVLFAWLVGFLSVGAFWMQSWVRTRRAVGTAKALSGSLEASPMRVLVSESVSSPGVCGLFRPVLLIPTDLDRRLTPAELKAVIAHEIAHVARRDNWTTAFHTIVAAVFWFHPFVWWIGRQLINERERAADEAALRGGHSADAFAEGLLKICRNAVGMPPECVAGISSSNLNARVEGIMKHTKTSQRGPLAGAVAGTIVLAVVIAPVTMGLTKPETIVVVTASTNLPEPPAPQPEEPEGAVEATVPQPENVVEEESSGQQIWVEQEVPYIISDEEREAFQTLETDEERERFIEQFWLRRDPTPGTERNEMQDEHYRRIAYANERFSFDGAPGSQTDRGAMFIMYGQPELMEGMSGTYSLPGDDYGRPVYPFERWRYAYVEGVGEEVVFEFVDPEGTGEYRLADTPDEKFMPVDAAETGGRAGSYYRAEASASRSSDSSSETD